MARLPRRTRGTGTNRRRTVIASIGVATMVTLAACSGGPGDGGGDDSEDGGSDDPIVIGISLP
ncbi:hypothetical protein [Serinibacter arcticus]|uniref:hypothetical protein n=1 Tax=Serinibacter arcticus TaxID=1655435 RepID=UPI0018EE9C9C|nr:hypothetical protein [Serinibacter arcticus]